MNSLTKFAISAIAIGSLAVCFATTSLAGTSFESTMPSPPNVTPRQAAAQPTEDQDAKDIKAYVLDQAKFEQITASFGDIAACRKQNRPAWDQLTGDPAYADATLTQKAKMMDAQVAQCTGLLKKHGFTTRDYLISVDVLSRSEAVSLMKKRNMTVAAAKASEGLNPGSIAFADAHYEEIEKWRQSIRAQAQASQQAPQAQPQQ
ncbi:MAG TPA: hypothetical protein VMP12_03045 [Candidatus Sulfotelmatobacter sp.]|nr:hypothetical protein [Candidatus Sulfotelmatobacter sp.]